MMKKVLSIFLVVLMAASCGFVTVKVGKSVPVTKSLEVEDFTSVTCNIPADIVYTAGAPSFDITLPSSLEELLEVTEKNGNLHIAFSKHVNNFRGCDIEIRLSSPVLSSVNINGAADLDIFSPVAGKDFSAVVNGAADLNISGLKASAVTIVINGAGDGDIEGLECDSFDAVINGAGDLEVSGSASSASVKINGAGDIDASSLRCDNFSQVIRGVGSVER